MLAPNESTKIAQLMYRLKIKGRCIGPFVHLVNTMLGVVEKVGPEVG